MILLLLLFCSALVLPACVMERTSDAERTLDENLTATSRAIEFEPYERLYDPSLGDIGVVVETVEIAAPAAIVDYTMSNLVRRQLQAALTASPNFRVIDRDAIEQIAREQRIANSGAMAPEERPSTGRLAGSSYLLKVTVTEFDEKVVGGESGVATSFSNTAALFGLFVEDPGLKKISLGLALGRPEVTIGQQTIAGLAGLTWRLVDVQTGVQVAAGEGKALLQRERSRQIVGVAGFRSGSTSFQDTVIAHALRVAVQESVRGIHRELSLRPRVIDERQRGSASSVQNQLE